jgi:hypothetical protein
MRVLSTLSFQPQRDACPFNPFNPTSFNSVSFQSLRALQKAGLLERVQREFGCSRTSLGLLLEAVEGVDSQHLEAIITERNRWRESKTVVKKRNALMRTINPGQPFPTPIAGIPRKRCSILQKKHDKPWLVLDPPFPPRLSHRSRNPGRIEGVVAGQRDRHLPGIRHREGDQHIVSRSDLVFS